MIHKKTKQSSFIIYPLNLNESLGPRKPPEETLMHVYPLKSRLLQQTGISKLPPPPLSKHSNKKSVTENAMLLAATNKQ